MYDVLIVLAPVQRKCARVQEPQLEEVDQHVKEVPPMTQTQNGTGYVSSMMMMPTFEIEYNDSGVDQLSNLRIGYHNLEVGPLLSNFGQRHYDLGTDSSSSYMYGHDRDRREHK